MHNPGPLYKPFENLVTINVAGKDVQVPEGNILLRAFQYIEPENIAYGRFCWNEECQYCRVTYDMGEGTQSHVALSCKLVIKPGMRITQMATEIRYCLRNQLNEQAQAATEGS